jgi:uncharacterized protein involved in outer membrane biogenesis
MSGRFRRRVTWLLRLAGLLLLLAAGWVAILVRTGLDERWARGAIVRQIENMTGGRAELQAFRFRLLGLRAELHGLTVHGREPEGTPPFFRADRLVVDVRLDSLVRRKISLDEITLDRPAVHVRFDEQGASNVPVPRLRQPPTPGKPFHERIFEIVVRRLRVNDGYILYNHVRAPLVAEGGDFQFALDYEQPSDAEPRYTGHFAWEQFVVVARRYLPFPTNIAGEFTLTREQFRLSSSRPA